MLRNRINRFEVIVRSLLDSGRRLSARMRERERKNERAIFSPSLRSLLSSLLLSSSCVLIRFSLHVPIDDEFTIVKIRMHWTRRYLNHFSLLKTKIIDRESSIENNESSFNKIDRMKDNRCIYLCVCIQTRYLTLNFHRQTPYRRCSSWIVRIFLVVVVVVSLGRLNFKGLFNR